MAETRLHPRLRLDALADVIGEEVVLQCQPVDISLGGCSFAGPGWESVGASVQIVLSFPSLSANLPVAGVVVRSGEDLGIRFTDLSDEQKWALRKHVRDAAAGGGSR